MFDLHVHADPDVKPRIGHDDDIARSYLAAGFSGFVLKAHYESTVGRASALTRRFPLDVVGGIALNQHTGGINPTAVCSTLSSGGRVVWFPTADSHTQEHAHLPRLADQHQRLTRDTIALPPITPVHTDAATLILDMIADHDALLCTGHVSTAECRWLWDQAQNRGIRRFLLTHPSYTVPAMDPDTIAQLARHGCHVEITAYQLLHQPGMTPERLATVAKAAGHRLVLTSDAGQPDSPEPPLALQQLVDVLARHGVDRGLLAAACDETPRALALPA